MALIEVICCQLVDEGGVCATAGNGSAMQAKGGQGVQNADDIGIHGHTEKKIVVRDMSRVGIIPALIENAFVRQYAGASMNMRGSYVLVSCKILLAGVVANGRLALVGRRKIFIVCIDIAAGAEHVSNIGVGIQQDLCHTEEFRLQQVILMKDAYKISCCRSDCVVPCLYEAGWAGWISDDADPVLVFATDGEGVIGRVVIENEDLVGGSLLIQYGENGLFDEPASVKCGDDDGEGHGSMVLMTRAGIPAAMLLAGIDLVTTELDPITLLAPISTPGRMTTPVPSMTFSWRMTGPLDVRIRSSMGI